MKAGAGNLHGLPVFFWGHRVVGDDSLSCHLKAIFLATDCQMMKLIPYLVLAAFLVTLSGCSSVQSFPERVRAGETVAIAAGWKHYFSRGNIAVTITPEAGVPLILRPEDIRASINLYPDPLSSLVLSQGTGSDVSLFSKSYGDVINGGFTGGDRDWWQTTVFVNIPPSTPVGNAVLTISNPEGESVSVTVNVVGSGGMPALFDAALLGPMNDIHLTTLERVDHYVVSFDGSVVPYAVQLDLSYSNLSGYVINPKGDIKNISWADNAGRYRVILSPANQRGFRVLSDLKFYVAVTSGTRGLASVTTVPDSLLAFDRNGNPVTGISANVVLVKGVAGLN